MVPNACFVKIFFAWYGGECLLDEIFIVLGVWLVNLLYAEAESGLDSGRFSLVHTCSWAKKYRCRRILHLH